MSLGWGAVVLIVRAHIIFFESESAYLSKRLKRFMCMCICICMCMEDGVVMQGRIWMHGEAQNVFDTVKFFILCYPVEPGIRACGGDMCVGDSVVIL